MQRDGDRESTGTCWAGLVGGSHAAFESWPSRQGMPKGTAGLVVHRIPWRCSPSEYDIREIPKISTLTWLSLHRSSVSWLAQRQQKSPP